MVFSSLVFLFAYLAVTLVIYYAVPRKARNIFLFFINLLFYGWGEPMLVFLMVFNIFFNYLGGYLVDKFRSDQKKKKLFLILTCALDIGILAVFKYTGLIVDTVNLLPFLNIPTVQNRRLPQRRARIAQLHQLRNLRRAVSAAYRGSHRPLPRRRLPA